MREVGCENCEDVSAGENIEGPPPGAAVAEPGGWSRRSGSVGISGHVDEGECGWKDIEAEEMDWCRP